MLFRLIIPTGWVPCTTGRTSSSGSASKRAITMALLAFIGTASIGLSSVRAVGNLPGPPVIGDRESDC